MKFHRTQKVVCIGELSEWDYTVPNFDEQLKIALGVRAMPLKNKVYEVEQPLELWHNNITYIKLKGFDNNIFDEKGFKPLEEKLEVEFSEEKLNTAMHILN